MALKKLDKKLKEIKKESIGVTEHQNQEFIIFTYRNKP
jgi:hypothetical protein